MSHRSNVTGTGFLLCSALLITTESALARGADDFRILHHEPLTLTEPLRQSQAGSALSDTGTRRISIDALGRSFELELTPNDRLIADLPTAQRDRIAASARLYRGGIVGVPDSWARLTQHQDGWSGMIFDGMEVHLIDRVQQVGGALALGAVQPGGAQTAPGSVLYRLADVQHDQTCGLAPGARALHSYQALTDHLRDLAPSAQGLATEQLPVTVVGDVEFAQGQADPIATLAARMNIVDGIFSSQVGVAIDLVDIRALSSNGPLTSTDAVTLLSQFGGFVNGTNTGLAHLFTGRNISGSVAGIAYLGVLCNSRFGVGVSEDLGSFGALIAAHELGHNFGAPHDNQGGSACAGTPGIYLMNPVINGSDQFSACSLQQMQPEIAAAGCITAIPDGSDPQADVRPALPVNPTEATVDTPFDFSIEVRNGGDDMATGVGVRIGLPSALLLVGAAPAGCGEALTDSGGLLLTCDLAPLAAGSSAGVDLTLLALDSGTFVAAVSTFADNDINASNDSVQAGFDISPSVDPCPDCIDFGATPTSPYANQDAVGTGSVSVQDGGATLALLGNRWRRTDATFTVTPNTVLEVDFRSTAEGEIHGLGFDEDDILNDSRIFQLFGTQHWFRALSHGTPYTQADLGTYKRFRIPVGQYYTGTDMRLVLVNDMDTGARDNTSAFRNLRIFEDTADGGGDGGSDDGGDGSAGCSVALSFDTATGLGDWVNSPASNCTTGAFVAGTPTRVWSGVVTQVDGDHTTGSGKALFTAANISAGTDDVDGGTCILESPTWTVDNASTLSLWYFHGQRDAGDDPGGDGFTLAVSTDGGATFEPLVSQGDVRSTAVWRQARRAIPAGSSVQLRVTAADGPSTGDLVEAGIDDLSICAQ
ncbi:M12 family metallo-peptidase [uncultured Thiohalocapsa sp.]|uniref:M12 family metallo-peptidase n=1 Tax=uncultured Thiohalocapsa sp. TaxID=768990 RepID=UPI0025E2E8BC|nr:M12 family metallo-peptidase [uncultured Thiohalocapsa sp.]